ncbi:MAG: phospho-N-acetylmuramoyl-pentapeptide-transferase [Eubacteriales bacterium]|nr:phospho-N-acetylmuramoyl-pentapeptide-transferase [Eubacteriales bacterium]
MFALPLSGFTSALILSSSFALCFFLFLKASRVLPLDRGRELAFAGAASKGKRTSAGLLFVIPACAVAAIFSRFDTEIYLYLLLVVLEMLAGYLDDNSKYPWGELKKGLIDLFISALAAYVFVYFQNTPFMLPVFGTSFSLPPLITFLLATALVWGSVNVVNITDGVDGLSASLGSITLASFLVFSNKYFTMGDFQPVVLAFLGGLLAYLFFNASPSTHLMGDAGSRALGVLIAITALKSQAPLLFIPFALVFILDGASSMLKLTVLRVTNFKSFMANIRTPLHDHVRKNLLYSDPQTVTRFCLFQFLISALVMLLI